MLFLDIRYTVVAATFVILGLGSQPTDALGAETPLTPAADEWNRDWKAAMNLVKMGDPNALPALESLFARARERPEKEQVAFKLVLSGVQDAEYFDYLAEDAQKAVDNAIPSPYPLDDNGFAVGTVPSDKFLAWCKEHGMEPEQVYLELQPSSGLILLSRTGDPRAFDLFVQGLKSENPATAKLAADGLALIGDERAIPVIVAAVEGSSTEQQMHFANALVFFESAEAHRIAREILKDPRILNRLTDLLGAGASTFDLYQSARRSAEITKSAFDKERQLFSKE